MISGPGRPLALAALGVIGTAALLAPAHGHHDGDGGGSSHQHLESGGSAGDQHDSGCTRVLHSVDELDDVLSHAFDGTETEGDGDSGSGTGTGGICVQINHQYVDNTTGGDDE
jgi:hypothetical protein